MPLFIYTAALLLASNSYLLHLLFFDVLYICPITLYCFVIQKVIQLSVITLITCDLELYCCFSADFNNLTWAGIAICFYHIFTKLVFTATTTNEKPTLNLFSSSFLKIFVHRKFFAWLLVNIYIYILYIFIYSGVLVARQA